MNQFSSGELRRLFSLRTDTRSDTHDTLRCKRCRSVKTIVPVNGKGGGGSGSTLSKAQTEVSEQPTINNTNCRLSIATVTFDRNAVNAAITCVQSFTALSGVHMQFMFSSVNAPISLFSSSVFLS